MHFGEDIIIATNRLRTRIGLAVNDEDSFKEPWAILMYFTSKMLPKLPKRKSYFFLTIEMVCSGIIFVLMKDLTRFGVLLNLCHLIM